MISNFVLTIIIYLGIDFKYIHYITDFNLAVSGKKIYYSLLLLFLYGRLMVYACNTRDEDISLLTFSQNLFFLGLIIYTLLYDYGEHLARFSYYLMPFMMVWLTSIYVLFKKVNNRIVFGLSIYLL